MTRVGATSAHAKLLILPVRILFGDLTSGQVAMDRGAGCDLCPTFSAVRCGNLPLAAEGFHIK